MRNINYSKFFTVLAILVLVFTVSCMKKTKFDEEERMQIQNYLEKNPNLQYELQPSGLYYMDVEEGSRSEERRVG